jgi:hypothetical protein
VLVQGFRLQEKGHAIIALPHVRCKAQMVALGHADCVEMSVRSDFRNETICERCGSGSFDHRHATADDPVGRCLPTPREGQDRAGRQTARSLTWPPEDIGKGSSSLLSWAAQELTHRLAEAGELSRNTPTQGPELHEPPPAHRRRWLREDLGIRWFTLERTRSPDL